MGQFKAVLALVVVAAFPASASAQTPTRSFADLQQVLKPGQSVMVTDTTGLKTRGVVKEVQASALVLTPLEDGSPQGSLALPGSTVAKIVRRESPRNGLLIGLAAGVAAALIFDRAVCSGDPECSWNAGYPIGMGMFVPSFAVLGAFVGSGIGSDPIYVAASPAPRRVAVAPWLKGRSGGAMLSLRF